MKYWVGIDLGSTTTKAVVLDDGGHLIGRGITNSRSNYDVACAVALGEALINARFGLISDSLRRTAMDPETIAVTLEDLGRSFRAQQYLAQLELLTAAILAVVGDHGEERSGVIEILDVMKAEAQRLFGARSERKSDFFRDLAGSRYLELAEEAARGGRVSFDRLVGLFDKAILDVENRRSDEDEFRVHMRAVLDRAGDAPPEVETAIDHAASLRLELVRSVGTGYGRATLPFPRERIRSEILCHGLGAHRMFPETRTALDIGGQDTKAIQIDDRGIVTSFQMNDRCAAGCGRYLGYIADEMNLGLHQLGPLACRSKRVVRINSTCTVFAGAELRERLSLGERREDILAGLHRAIILRAMSLLARSGGVTDEFTFTGGVAKNPAAVAALRSLIRENYGDVTINISPDSIYTGALGAALFARRDHARAA